MTPTPVQRAPGGEQKERFHREASLELQLSARNKISFLDEEEVATYRMGNLNNFNLFFEPTKTLDVKYKEV